MRSLGPEPQCVRAVKDLELSVLIGLSVLIAERLNRAPTVGYEPLAHIPQQVAATAKSERVPPRLGHPRAPNQLQRLFPAERRNLAHWLSGGRVLNRHR